ncbi:IMPACT family protein [Acerihabitans arboris]|uniref:IMPACT family protein n=1 Tax=Acerihabitans arboris TaxID=2691583 RepID=A0A845SPK3_9GAMM|nr:IMPACT family protein [Acerihabitans arboris]NDL64521.1 IMPACT family protein [Acerihabitans arboris]
MHAYFVPAAPVTASMEIKKSRFIILLSPTQGIEAVKAFVQQNRDAHPGAVHYCWACIAGPPLDSQQLGFSDDGEPPGNAGKPMLARLMGSGLGEVTAVVVRYYGGIRLGTGGLVKAYGGGVQQALKLINRAEKIPQAEFMVSCGYEQQAWIDAMIKQTGGRVVQSDYGESIILRVAIPFGRVALAEEKLRDLSRGALQLTPIAQ